MKDKIAFDFDNVLCDTNKAFIRFNKLQYGNKLKFKQIGRNLNEDLGIDLIEYDKRWGQFFNNYNFSHPKPRNRDIRFITKLQKDYKLIIITAREKRWHHQIQRWLELYMNGLFEKIIFLNKSSENHITKADICKKYECLFLVDDSIDNINDCLNSNIKAVLYNQPWNKDFPEKVGRINSLSDLQKFLSI